MAYNDHLAERIRIVLNKKHSSFSELKMMGGLCFKVDEKMLCGIHFDKKCEQNLLMARIGEEAYEDAILKENTLPMDFTGRPMKGYVFVKEAGFDFENDLEHWLQLCLDYNPSAKASAKKKKSM